MAVAVAVVAAETGEVTTVSGPPDAAAHLAGA